MCRWNTHLGRQDRSHHQHEVGNNLWPSPGQDFAHLSAQNANTKRFIFACFRASPSPKSKSKPKLSSLLYFLFSDLRLPLFADKILGCRGGGAGRQQKGSAPVRSLSPFSVPRQKRIWKGGGWRKKVSGCANVPYFLRTEMKLKHKLENSGPDSWAKVSRNKILEKIYAQSPNVMNEWGNDRRRKDEENEKVRSRP